MSIRTSASRSPIPPTPSRYLAVGLVAVGVLALGACSSGGDGGSPATSPGTASSRSSAGSTTPGAATTAPAATATVTTSAVPTVTGSPAPGEPGSVEQGEGGASGPPACAESQLRALIDPRHIPGNGTGDAHGRTKQGVLIDFRNTSTSTCSLFGYPGAAIEDASNRQLRQATRTLRGPLGGLPASQTAPSTVVLAPGRYAAALIEGVDLQEHGAAQAGCASVTPRILVTPPNTRIPVPFAESWGRCFSFEVHPVRELPTAP